MKQVFISTIIILAALGTRAQTTETREVKPFKNINISGAASVEYIESDTLQVKVLGDAGEIQNISTASDGETLIVKSKGNMSHAYKILVFSKGLSQVICSGASKINAANTIHTDSLTIDASGASVVNLDVSARVLDVLSNGASSVSLQGNTQVLYANFSGASALKAYRLNAASANVTTSGASSAKVFALDKITANATGASSVRFKGDPKDVSVEASVSSVIAKVAGDDSQKRMHGKDSTTFNFKKKKFIIINADKDKDSTKITYDQDKFRHWAGFSMGVNGWLSGAGSFNLPQNASYMSLNYGKSLNFQLNVFEHDFHIYKNYVNLVTGLGFEWNQYEFSNHVTLNPDGNFTSGKVDTSGINYIKNRLKTTFADVPLLFEFNTNKNPDKAFHVALGLVGGYKLGSRTRQITDVNGTDIKRIRKDDYNLNPIRVNAHIGLGYARWTLFADYALTPLFENGKGPNVYPFTIGLRIVPF